MDFGCDDRFTASITEAPLNSKSASAEVASGDTTAKDLGVFSLAGRRRLLSFVSKWCPLCEGAEARPCFRGCFLRVLPSSMQVGREENT